MGVFPHSDCNHYIIKKQVESLKVPVRGPELNDAFNVSFHEDIIDALSKVNTMQSDSANRRKADSPTTVPFARHGTKTKKAPKRELLRPTPQTLFLLCFQQMCSRLHKIPQPNNPDLLCLNKDMEILKQENFKLRAELDTMKDMEEQISKMKDEDSTYKDNANFL